MLLLHRRGKGSPSRGAKKTKPSSMSLSKEPEDKPVIAIGLAERRFDFGSNHLTGVLRREAIQQ